MEKPLFTDDGIDAILLIGQSNMCGRGIIGSVPSIDPRDVMFMARCGRWRPMTEPIFVDRPIFVQSETSLRSGISLAASFAESYADTYGRKVGLIPCAFGGTTISEWQPGETLFDYAVMYTKLIMRHSVLRGILWHQGESDAGSPETVACYEEKFFTMLDALKEELALDDSVPFILGEITELCPDRWGQAREFNLLQHQIAGKRDFFGIAGAEGLGLGPDGTHFSAQSYREFGRRYFAEFDRVKKNMGARTK